MALSVELKILDTRLSGWGFPSYGSKHAAGLDLHACLGMPLLLRPQARPALISAGIAFRIGNPEWCALVLPRSGLGHREGLVLGNAVGLIDPDYEGACLISAWNRNPIGGADEGIESAPATASRSWYSRAWRGRALTSFTSSSRARWDRPTAGQGGFGSTGIAAACPKAAGEPKRSPDDPADKTAAVRDRGGSRHRL